MFRNYRETIFCGYSKSDPEQVALVYANAKAQHDSKQLFSDPPWFFVAGEFLQLCDH